MKSKIVTQLVMVEQSKASEIKLKGVKILQRAFLGWNHHFKNNYNIQILSETFGFIDGFYSIDIYRALMGC